MNNSYTLPSFTGILSHSWKTATLVRDGERKSEVYPLEAKVRSGDYFVTLAMELDMLNKMTDDVRIKSPLEEIISDLIHMQDNYVITKPKSTK